MALQDILQAIVSDADKRIADLAALHEQSLRALRTEHEDQLARTQARITQDRDQKMRQMKEKAESHARMSKSKALLALKQENMDKLYAEALKALVALPKDKTEQFLSLCLRHIQGTGVICPSVAHEAILQKILPAGCRLGKPIKASGGFRFESDKEEYDCTYEFLVHTLLRQHTEVLAANVLFSTNE